MIHSIHRLYPLPEDDLIDMLEMPDKNIIVKTRAKGPSEIPQAAYDFKLKKIINFG